MAFWTGVHTGDGRFGNRFCSSLWLEDFLVGVGLHTMPHCPPPVGPPRVRTAIGRLHLALAHCRSASPAGVANNPRVVTNHATRKAADVTREDGDSMVLLFMLLVVSGLPVGPVRYPKGLPDFPDLSLTAKSVNVFPDFPD